MRKYKENLKQKQSTHTTAKHNMRKYKENLCNINTAVTLVAVLTKVEAVYGLILVAIALGDVLDQDADPCSDTPASSLSSHSRAKPIDQENSSDAGFQLTFEIFLV